MEVTVKEAATLKKGDRVMLTRDAAIWRVTRVRVHGSQWVEVSIRTPRGPVLTLGSAPALRSLKRAPQAGEENR